MFNFFRFIALLLIINSNPAKAANVAIHFQADYKTKSRIERREDYHRQALDYCCFNILQNLMKQLENTITALNDERNFDENLIKFSSFIDNNHDSVNILNKAVFSIPKFILNNIEEENNCIKALQAFFTYKNNFFSCDNSYFTYLLYFAVKESKVEVVAFLLEVGADPNAVFTELETPILFMACRNANIALVELLLKHGANPNAVDINNINIFKLIINCENSRKRSQMREILLKAIEQKQ